jgi:beta-mannosidase
LKSGEKAVRVAMLRDTLVGIYDFSTDVSSDGTPTSATRKTIFICEFSSSDHKLDGHTLTAFVPNKHLDLQEPGIQSNVTEKDSLLTIGIQAASLARFVELSFEGADVIFSDNYFDVPAGSSIYVTAPLPAGWTSDQARAALRVRSLIDSYQ